MAETSQSYTGTVDRGNISYFTFRVNMEGAQTTVTDGTRYVKQITINGPTSSGSFNTVYMNVFEINLSTNVTTYIGSSKNATHTNVNVSATWEFNRLQLSTGQDYLFTFTTSPSNGTSGLTATRMALYKLNNDTTHKCAGGSYYPYTSTLAYMPVMTFVFTTEPNRGSISVEDGYYKSPNGQEILIQKQTKSYYDLVGSQPLGVYNNIFVVSKDYKSDIVISKNNFPSGSFDVYKKLDGQVCMPTSGDYFLGSPKDMTGVEFNKVVNEYKITQYYSNSDNRLQMTDKYWLTGFSSKGTNFGCGMKNGTSGWDIIIKYKTGLLVSGVREQLFSVINSSQVGISLYSIGYNLWLQVSSGSSWDIANQQSSISLKSNTWYFFRITYFDNGDFAWRNAETTEDAKMSDNIEWTWDIYQATGKTPVYGIEGFLGMYIYYNGSQYMIPSNYYQAKGQFDLLNCKIYDNNLVDSRLILKQYAGWTAVGGDVYVNELERGIEANNLYDSFLTTPSNPAYICSDGNNGLCLVNGIDSTVQTPYRYLGNKKAFNVVGNNKYVFNNAANDLCKIYKQAINGVENGRYLAYNSEVGLYMSNLWPLNPPAGNIPIPYPTKVSNYTYNSADDAYTIDGSIYKYIGDYYADCGPQMFSNVLNTPATMPDISKDLIMSGFSDTKYFAVGIPTWLSSGWNAQFKLKIKSAGRWQKLTGTTSDFKGPAFGLTSGDKFQLESSTNGSSWGINIVGSLSPVEDTWYWVRFGWNGATYFIDVSTDGVNFTRDASVNSTNASTASLAMLIGRTWDTANGGAHWRGEIDLKESWIKIGNNPDASSVDDYAWRGALPFDALKAPKDE